MREIINQIADLIHEIQLERGLASLYLRENSNEFSPQMEGQFAKVDAIITKLKNTQIGFSAHVEPLKNALLYIETKRRFIVSRQISPSDALLFYTREIVSPSIEIIQELAILDKQNSPSRVSSLINFLQWKERVGLERALGTQFIQLSKQNANELSTRLNYIIDEQQAYERMFMALADDHCREAIIKLEKNNEIFQKIELINHTLAKGNYSQIASQMTPKEWFALLSAKMDLLHEVGKIISNNLEIIVDKTQITNPIDTTNDIAHLESRIDSKILANMETIRTLNLFKGVEYYTILEILKHARITTFVKGNLIFQQGEIANRLYIVLDGWVKLSKGDIDGQESILQIMHKGEALLESVLKNGATFPVSAQSIEKSLVLSVPASFIREQMQENKFLAINMLATVASRSQELITQFEQ
ncbi:MAG: nitrate- and nitrite sensing domain-containing protein, partial [Caulobacterales bacterium]|nr:nitrate- and nitrite sensing domain-containing protein [Caulobacterales bacterium]